MSLNMGTNLTLTDDPVRSGADGERANWRDICLAALPHLLLASTFGPSALFPSSLVAARLMPYLLLAAMLAAFLLAWRRGWPLWSGSWAGYWLLLPFYAFSWLPLRMIELLVLLVLLVAGAFIFQRRPLYGLLASFPPLLLLTRLFAFELVSGGEWILSGIWLLLAITAGAIVWWGSLRAGVRLMIAFHLAAGLAFALGLAYLPYRWPGHMGARQPPTLVELVNDFAPLTLVAVVIPLALLLLHPLWQLGRQGGSSGRRSHWLLLGGMALTFGGFFIGRMQPALLPGDITSIVSPLLTVSGLLLAVAAAVWLARISWLRTNGRFYVALLPLLAVLAPLVVFRLARPFGHVGPYDDSFQVMVLLSYIGVFLWLFGTLLVINRQSHSGIKEANNVLVHRP
jgi:hypothetical protein